MTYTEMTSLSMNQVLLRSLNTTIVVAAAGASPCSSSAPASWAPSPSRSSPSPCSSAWSSAPTRRSSWPPRSWSGSRSASPRTAPIRERLGGPGRRRRPHGARRPTGRSRPRRADLARRSRSSPTRSPTPTASDGTAGPGGHERPPPPGARRDARPRRRRRCHPAAAPQEGPQALTRWAGPRGPTLYRGVMSPAPDAAATITRLVRDIPDWPQPGVVFKDITPLLADADGFARRRSTRWPTHVRCPAGDRPGARHRGPGLHVRRAGRLPPRRRVRAGAQAGQAARGDIEREEYVLEYGIDLLEIHRDARPPGRAGADRRRRARHRRHRGGHRPPGREARRGGRRLRLRHRAGLPRRPRRHRRATTSTRSSPTAPTAPPPSRRSTAAVPGAGE